MKNEKTAIGVIDKDELIKASSSERASIGLQIVGIPKSTIFLARLLTLSVDDVKIRATEIFEEKIVPYLKDDDNWEDVTERIYDALPGPMKVIIRKRHIEEVVFSIRNRLLN